MAQARQSPAAASGAFTVRRWRSPGGWTSRRDELAMEEPLELRVNTRSVAVLMRTPGHDEELAAGFLLTEGVVKRRDEISGIRPYPRNREGNVLDVWLREGVDFDVAALTRHVFGASSCGLCGKATIAAIRRQFARVQERFTIPISVLKQLPEAMRARQTAFDLTGGLHAAALFDTEGHLIVLREDVGRHNAVDKVLGRALLDDRLPLRESILIVSGRASFEILQKALAGGVAIVGAIGAPSTLSVEFARAGGQTLVGFLRNDRLNVYAGAARLRDDVRQERRAGSGRVA